ncbi:MAG: hypothetical protein MK135_14135 [Polyangiaceae bacterium]|nr:hypothetical protein [Polyangiaceae bacterium]
MSAAENLRVEEGHGLSSCAFHFPANDNATPPTSRAARSASRREGGASDAHSEERGGGLPQLYAYVSGYVLKAVDPVGLEGEDAGQCGVDSSCETVASLEDGSEEYTDGTTTVDAESKNAEELQSKPRDPETTKYAQQSSAIGFATSFGGVRVEAGSIVPVEGGKVYLFREVDVANESVGFASELMLWKTGTRTGAGDTPDDGESTDSKQTDVGLDVRIKNDVSAGGRITVEQDSEGNTKVGGQGGIGIVSAGVDTDGKVKVAVGVPGVSYEASGDSLHDTDGQFAIAISGSKGMVNWGKSRTVYDPEAD